MSNEKLERWQGKDAIRLAVFSLLLFLAMLIGAIPFSITLTSYFYGDALGAVLSGIVWMYLRATVRKPWACLFSSLIVAVLALLLGQIWTAVLGVVVGGVLSEIIVRIGGYRSAPANIVAFVVWVLCFWVGHGIMALVSADAFAQMMMNAHMSAEQVEVLLGGLSGMNLVFAPLACALGALVGGLLGYVLFKRHFQHVA